jgi:hypothetical protein
MPHPAPPTIEELEFADAELKALVAKYGIEDSIEAIEELRGMVQEGIRNGVIEYNAKGLKQGMNAIFEKRPDLLFHFNKFLVISLIEAFNKPIEQ